MGLINVLLVPAPVLLDIKDDFLCRINWTLCEDPKRLMYAQDMMTVKTSDIETNRLKVTSGTSLMQHIVDKFRNTLTEDMIEPNMSPGLERSRRR